MVIIREISKIFQKEINNIDKLLIILIFPFPLYLATSIFIADFFSSIAGLILIYLYSNKKNRKIFESLNKEIFFL